MRQSITKRTVDATKPGDIVADDGVGVVVDALSALQSPSDRTYARRCRVGMSSPRGTSGLGAASRVPGGPCGFAAR
jgi:hypothetical protein